ncbi:outer membrane receptor for ferric coprogen and ferric-rhodotorulic acid [Ochrobactrum sp. AN78]|nr:outer membrane receptor for ferric coprogen and ferric-rhodotorulic acid [Ochrobactrum sp. AN78]
MDQRRAMLQAGNMKTQFDGRQLAKVLLASSVLGCVWTLECSSAFAQAQPAAASSQSIKFQIPAQPLSSAINAFINQSGWQISYSSELVRGKRSSGLSGSLAPALALQRLVAGTGISVRVGSAGSAALINPKVGAVEAASVGEGAIILDTISVQGQGATTEGTGSYTTSQMTTATGLPLSIKETPQAVTVVTRQQIDDQGARSLSEILRGTTGVSESAYDSERSSFSYRGFDVDNYQYDGVPTTFNNAFAAGESELDSVIYDRVEIVRGATGLMNGAGNPGASINLVRKRASSTSLTGAVSASAGSWNNYRSTVDVSTPLNKAGTLRGRFITAGQLGDSFIDRYEKKKGVVFGTIEADLTENTTLRVGADYQINRPKASTWGGAMGAGWFSNGELIDWPLSFSGAPNWSRWNSKTQSQFATLDHSFDNGWKGQVGYSHSKQNFDARMGMSIGGLVDPMTWTSQTKKVYSEWYEGYREQHAINAKLDGDFELLGRNHEFMIGGSSAWQQNYGTVRTAAFREDYNGSLLDWNGDYAEPIWNDPKGQLDNDTRQIGLYSAVRLNISDPLKLILGARYTDYKNTQTDTFKVVSPYAGIVYDLNDNLSVYASYTDIFQPQDYLDKNGNFLDPLQGSNYETGVKGSFFDDRLNASFSMFLTKQDNVAEAELDALVPGTGGQAYYGVDGTQSKGFEAEVGGEILPNWNIRAGYSRFNLKDPEGVELNTPTPRETFNFYSTYQFSGALEKLTVGGGMRWQSGVWATVWGADGSGETVQRRAEQKPYAIVNLMARYDLTDKTALQFNANNILDERYFSQVNFYSTRNYGEPRNFTLKLSQKF